MLQSKYQRVGALAGLVMFFGGWLTAFYDQWAWMAVAVAAALIAFWFVLEEETTEELTPRVVKGFVLGVTAALVARLLGLLTMVWAFDSWSTPVTVSYDSVSDLFRVLMNGNLTQSLVAILGVGAAAAFIAYAMPYFAAEREEE